MADVRLICLANNKCKKKELDEFNALMAYVNVIQIDILLWKTTTKVKDIICLVNIT